MRNAFKDPARSVIKPRSKQSRPAKRHGPRKQEDGRVWLYGRHAASAALKNPQRKIVKILATENTLQWLEDNGAATEAAPRRTEEIDAALPPGAVHQGLAVLAEPLAAAQLEDLVIDAGGKPLVILDQISDPQNIGAIFRAALAFGAGGVIAQDRKTPPLAGALAKAAAGAVEALPFAPVVNLARALETAAKAGYLVAGLAGETETPLGALPKDRPIALVLGAEGAGLRRLTREKCDMLVRIPMSEDVESLNVATAAAIALYEISRKP